LTAWDRNGGRAVTPTATDIVVKDIIFILIAIVIVIIIIVVIIVVVIVKEGWLNEVMVIFCSNGWRSVNEFSIMGFNRGQAWWWELLIGLLRGWQSMGWWRLWLTGHTIGCGVFCMNMIFEPSSIEKPADTVQTSKTRLSSCGGMKTIHLKYLDEAIPVQYVQIQPEGCDGEMIPRKWGAWKYWGKSEIH